MPAEPDLSLRPALRLQGREGEGEVHHQGRAQQSGRHGLDRSDRTLLRHPRHALAQGQQDGIARLRAPDQLGRTRSLRHGA